MAVKRGDVDRCGYSKSILGIAINLKISSIPSLKPLAGGGSERMKLKIVDFDAEILRMNYEVI